ncbi:MAG: DUF1501 domain-containing protein [Isosphaeraceae bacterium]|nr:DUF1501 domain-containing protein [Isosphaeraceae bacterium]
MPPRPMASDVSRRQFLGDAGAGLGAVALAWLLNQQAAGETALDFVPKAKRVIQIFACGGVSHVDTFDYKPALARHDGQEMTGKGKIDTFFGRPGRLLKSPFAFRQYGECGHWASDLLPNLAGCVDQMTFLHAMTGKSSNHTPATFLMNSGFTMNGFPSLGAWLSYGLGTVSQDLPAFVVLPDPRGLPAGGAINWTSGFLPASHQGVSFRTSGQGGPVANLLPPPEISPDGRRSSLALLDTMNREDLAAHPGDSALAARIHSYELAARMQVSIPEVIEFADESPATRRLYGFGIPTAEPFGRNCLLARRLVERGVRFVQLYHGGAFGSPRINWDAHENVVENHTTQAASLDLPLAGLLTDLKGRGLLDDTLVVFTTEFGRTPFTEGIGGKGRDHHQLAFTCWLAGAGLKPGFSLGASDDVGYQAAEHPVNVHDLHATVLYLLGIDHKRLTYYHNGIRRRLTDVHGEVIREILA